jgi:mannose-6-phosphate isomerase
VVGRVEAWREPLLLEGSLHETIWGGQGLEIVGKRLPAGARVGESWETAVESVVRVGAHRGRTLGELVDEWGEQLIGWRARAVYGPRFPLLTKFIDAHEWLSVQVHPDDAYAARHEGGKLGKTEMWLVLRAEPGARLAYGLKRAASPAEVRAVIAATHLEELLCTFEPRPGDVVFVPAGTIHAIGGGILLYELQEYSDVTSRLYDYGRIQADGRPRALHVARALDVMRFAPHAPARVVTPPSTASSAIAQRRILSACRYFVVEELQLAGNLSTAIDPASCAILTVLSGSCAIQTTTGDWPLALGDTAVLPASLGPYTLAGREARLVRAYVPREDDPALDIWRAAQPADPFA